MTAPIRERRSLARGDETMRREVLAGLLGEPKTIAPKYFYDDQGARLFEQICEQPEYYLTCAEVEVMRTHAADIAVLAGAGCAVVEYGSGAALKTRLLLEALDRPSSYTPVDISREQLDGVSAALAREYRHIPVLPVHADYTTRFELPRLPAHARRLAYFPGSTIGNFHPVEAIAFLQRVRAMVGRGGALLLGVDRRKSSNTLDRAYNDAAGVTARFNLNVLARFNRELGATFDLSRFRHHAFFNEDRSRIEMHLRSTARQSVWVARARVEFDEGETIWTESSYKYDVDALDALVQPAGFRLARVFTDAAQQFTVAFLTT